jgi:hypothetical protein
MGLVLALPLALGGGVALADGGPGSGGPGGAGSGGWGTTGSTGPSGTTAWPSFQFPVPVVGTVVSTDAGGNADSFVADVYAPSSFVPGPWSGDVSGQQGSGPDFGQLFGSLFGSMFGSGSNTGIGSDIRSHDDGAPATTPVTITAGDGTMVFVNGSSGDVAGLSPNDDFVALFDGSLGESVQTLVQGSPLLIIDHTPPAPKQLYAFVGSVSDVSSTDAHDGTVTVDVQGALPSSIASSGDSVPLTVTSGTLILGGSSSSGLGSDLTDVSDGDIVVAGLVAPQGDTLSQVEALPLKVLFDIPVTVSGSETQSQAREQALKQAFAMIGEKVSGKKSKKSKHSKKSHKKAHTKKSHTRHANKHAHRK